MASIETSSRRIKIIAEVRKRSISEKSLEFGTYFEQLLSRDGFDHCDASVVVDIPDNSHVRRKFINFLQDIGLEVRYLALNEESTAAISIEGRNLAAISDRVSDAWQKGETLSATFNECMDRHINWAASTEGKFSRRLGNGIDTLLGVLKTRRDEQFKLEATRKARQTEADELLKDKATDYPGAWIFDTFKAHFEDLLKSVVPESRWDSRQEWLVATLERIATDNEFCDMLFQQNGAGEWMPPDEERIWVAMRKTDEEWSLEWQAGLSAEQYFTYFQADFSPDEHFHNRLGDKALGETRNDVELHKQRLVEEIERVDKYVLSEMELEGTKPPQSASPSANSYTTGLPIDEAVNSASVSRQMIHLAGLNLLGESTLPTLAEEQDNSEGLLGPPTWLVLDYEGGREVGRFLHRGQISETGTLSTDIAQAPSPTDMESPTATGDNYSAPVAPMMTPQQSSEGSNGFLMAAKVEQVSQPYDNIKQSSSAGTASSETFTEHDINSPSALKPLHDEASQVNVAPAASANQEATSLRRSGRISKLNAGVGQLESPPTSPQPGKRSIQQKRKASASSETLSEALPAKKRSVGETELGSALNALKFTRSQDDTLKRGGKGEEVDRE